MRRLILGCLALLPYACAPARAEEPLFLRIVPNDSRARPDGNAPLSDDEVAARARAEREAVWQRAERRARLAVASVCTGCLKPGASESSRPASPATETAERAAVSADVPEAAAMAGAAPLSVADSR